MSLEERRSEAGPQRGPGGGTHTHKRQLLKEQIRLRKRCTPQGGERFEIVPIPESLSFEKGFFLFIRAVQTLAQANDGVILVGLAGPSGAGKTEFSKKVVSFMPGISLISMDNYNDASKVIDGNFDDPRITDYDLLLENIASLRGGKAAEVPIYDFKTSRRVGFQSVPVPSCRIIILEGIYALSERLCPTLDLRVSITGGVHFDLVKRVLRDIDRSGQPPEEIIAQISETVYPMYKAFIEPDLEKAHIRIVNKFNPFSGFQDATYILKAPRDVLQEESVRTVLSASAVENMEETCDIYLLPPGEDKETCVSYLRMRNRDGKYSLMFEEWVTDGPFVITPRITFEVSVRLLGGLMTLGYEIAHVIKRQSIVFKDPELRVTVKLDHLEQLSKDYVQVQGKDRAKVKEIGEQLNMEGKYIAKPYIEQIQLENLTNEVQAPSNPKTVVQHFRVPEDQLRVGGGGRTLITPRASLPASWSEGGSFIPKGHSTNRLPSHDLDPGLLSPSSSMGDTDAPTLTVGPRGVQGQGQGQGQAHALVIAASNTAGSRRLPGVAQPIRGAQLLAPDVSQLIMEQMEGLLKRLDAIEARLTDSASRHATPPTRPAAAAHGFNPASSASALSNQLSTAGMMNGIVPNGIFIGSSHTSPIGTVAAGMYSHNRSISVPPMDPLANGGLPAGTVPMELMRGTVRSSFELPKISSPAKNPDSLEEVRLLARNQSKMADELESLSSMLRQKLVSDTPKADPPSIRLEAVITASAVVSMACACALVFVMLRSKA